MSRVAVVGYASCDYAMACGGFRGAAGTTRVTRRLSEPWHGLGGIAYAARETVVVYDPGDCAAEALTGQQREIIAGCDWVCLMVGPRTITSEVLDLLSDQELAWCVKGDPDAYPAELVRRILARASVAAERGVAAATDLLRSASGARVHPR